MPCRYEAPGSTLTKGQDGNKAVKQKAEAQAGHFKNSEKSTTKGRGCPTVPPDFPGLGFLSAIAYSEDLGGQSKPPALELQSLGASLSRMFSQGHTDLF